MKQRDALPPPGEQTSPQVEQFPRSAPGNWQNPERP
jgi:hypothetical protein